MVCHLIIRGQEGQVGDEWEIKALISTQASHAYEISLWNVCYLTLGLGERSGLEIYIW